MKSANAASRGGCIHFTQPSMLQPDHFTHACAYDGDGLLLLRGLPASAHSWHLQRKAWCASSLLLFFLERALSMYDIVISCPASARPSASTCTVLEVENSSEALGRQL
mmetsp:Transcript_24446/g.61874  ORF Transcript_24446/g.61874 Transcript_24446/m.61874 type:complete len:108 (+) Transcript_24446:1371-1694(+)